SLFLGSSSVTAGHNDDRRRRESSPENADCPRRPRVRGLRHRNAGRCVSRGVDRDGAGTWNNHRCGCVRSMFRSRRATPHTRAPSTFLKSSSQTLAWTSRGTSMVDYRIQRPQNEENLEWSVIEPMWGSVDIYDSLEVLETYLAPASQC